MALVEMVMPKMGESVMEGTVLKWLKEVGEDIEQDESVLEVATDKVDTEVPAPYEGTLHEILAQEGDVVEVGKPIAILSTDAEDAPAADSAPATSTASVEASAATPAAQEPAMAEATAPTAAVQSNGVNSQTASRFYSPLVKSIAQRENISVAELESIQGTGQEGRVTKNDILDYVANRGAAPAPQPQPHHQEPVAPAQPEQQRQTQAQAPIQPQSPSVSVNGNSEIMEMDRMRKVIAQRMVDSKRTSPHVTSFVEADVTNIVRWRNQHKDAFKERGYGSLTFTPIFIEAIAKTLRDYPMVNISVDAGNIIKHKDIHIGMATALPSGNLIVPVIKNADQLNLAGLAIRVNDLAKRARDNRLSPDELSGGTYTMSNVGSFGNVMGTPIIVQPQVGIMAVGAVRKKPAVVETPEGDMIGIRHTVFLSHSYDHRVVDGALGGMFVRKMADYLENFDTEQAI